MKSDFEVIKSKVDNNYIGFYKPCPSLTFCGKTKEETLQGIKDAVIRIEEVCPRLKQLANLQEEGLKDIPKLLEKLKKIDEEF